MPGASSSRSNLLSSLRSNQRTAANARTMLMTITITLPPAAEAQLRRQAQATGKDLSALVVEAVEARLAASGRTFRQILAPVHDQVRQSSLSQDQIDKLLADELTSA